MPRGPSKPWKAVAEHTSKALPMVEAAYKQAGYEREVVWSGHGSREEATTAKNGIFNACRLHKPQLSVSTVITAGDDGTWSVRFTLHDKKKARALMVEKYGEDRSKWPYNPRQKAS